MAIGYSIHVGLNHVDPTAYGGWDGELAGCVNDATDMCALAVSQGYRPTMLLDEQATSTTVLAELRRAAGELSGGDILLFTYSGHGGQVTDVDGDEDDRQDETLVLWDRQLVDDELHRMWSQFAPGVRVVMLADSCHSGTAAKVMAAQRMRAAAVRADVPRVLPTMTAGGRGATGALPPPSYAAEGAAPGDPSAAALPRTRNLPVEAQQRNVAAMGPLYATVRLLSGPKAAAGVRASVLLISGCQDNQLSYDGEQNGRFTQELLDVWQDGAFEGDYHSFHLAILDNMPADQSPRLFLAGAANDAFARQRPFAIEAVAPGAVNTGGAPSTRPVLRRGARGAFVQVLQQRLQAHGYFIADDADFGSRTEAAVRAFQREHTLAIDGVVGRATWAVLDAAPLTGVAASPSGGAGAATTGAGPGGRAVAAPGRSTLRQGAEGAEVEHLQQRLIIQGYAVTVDGSFGPRTAAVLRSMQRGSGLVADAVVGPQTWAVLEEQPAWA
ncbi:MAG TPA: peptidoglycan-binding protein [Catenuloplanes sp.]|jgi:peptidoglycan hydrolase-like protein with peptidoglycan-binding domain